MSTFQDGHRGTIKEFRIKIILYSFDLQSALNAPRQVSLMCFQGRAQLEQHVDRWQPQGDTYIQIHVAQVN